MLSHKVGDDILKLKKNFHIYKPSIASTSAQMFWVAVAVTLSFIISQTYLLLTR